MLPIVGRLDETGWVRRASLSKGHYEVGCREKEPAKRFVQCSL
jgi:hypothetical protein